MSIKDDMEDVQEAVINELISDNGLNPLTVGDLQITTAKIADDAVTLAKLGSDVDLGQVNDDAVTLAKLGSDVNLGQVNTGAVTEHKIANGAVTPAKLSQAYLPLTGGSVTGNMGIGIANPVLPTSWGRVLHLHSATANGSAIRISDVASGSGDDGLKIGNYAQNSYLNNTDSGFMRFDTNGAEAMRIQSDGMLCVGTALTSSLATQNSQTGVQINAVGRFLVCNDAHHDFNKQNSGELIRFRRNATAVGSISVSSTATTYNTSSDYRLKTDAQPMTGATARLKALNPVNFEWISDGTRVDGFLAHEAQEVVPESVTGTKDALDEEGNPEYQGIDQSKLVPLLTAALQEALTKIEALEVRITNLEA